MDEIDLITYDTVVEALEYNEGDFYNRDDLKDAIVDVTCNLTHFTDEELDEVADYLYAVDDAILHGA